MTDLAYDRKRDEAVRIGDISDGHIGDRELATSCKYLLRGYGVPITLRLRLDGGFSAFGRRYIQGLNGGQSETAKDATESSLSHLTMSYLSNDGR